MSNINSITINNHEYFLNDTELRELVDQIVTTISSNNNTFSQYINSLNNRIIPLEEKMDLLQYIDSSNDTFAITDAHGYVSLKINENGFDVNKISESFINKLNNDMTYLGYLGHHNIDYKVVTEDILTILDFKVIAKFNNIVSGVDITICNNTDNILEIEVDNIKLPNMVHTYTFNTSGEHIIKYTFKNNTYLDSGTFSNCGYLTSIVIPDSVTSIGIATFQYCGSLTSISIPNSVTSIGNGAFQYCGSLTSISIPSSVTSIGEGAFNGCTWLTSINIPNGVTSIRGGTFYQCSRLTSISIPSSVTSIGDGAFYKCSSLTSISIPSGVISIGGGAFNQCSSLTSISIPSGVISIGDGAFYKCNGLTSIDIPDSVTSIGNNAFYQCSSLTSIVSNATTAPSIQSATFYNMNTNGTLTVPSGSSGYDTWMTALGSGWTKIEQ